MEPMTRIELVTSPLPRGCSTAKLHGPKPTLLLSSFLFSTVILPIFHLFRPIQKLREVYRHLITLILLKGQNQQRNWAELDSNQRRLAPTSLQPVSFSHSDIRPKPVMGFEPATYGLQNRCSAIELHRQGCQSRLAILLAPL